MTDLKVEKGVTSFVAEHPITLLHIYDDRSADFIRADEHEKAIQLLNQAGIVLARTVDNSESVHIRDSVRMQGVFVDGPVEPSWFNRWDWSGLKEPFLILVTGDCIPAGWVDELSNRCDYPSFEVVRLLLWPEQKRAFIGGQQESVWKHRLRRLLANSEIISLVCSATEVDEIARACREFLLMKQRFYLSLGERCEQTGARLDVVAKGLGLDRRIGQGWWFGHLPELAEQGEAWLRRRWIDVRHKMSVRTAALWGYSPLYVPILQELLADIEVRLYISANWQKPNDIPPDWSICPGCLEAVENADVLLVFHSDRAIRELPLTELARRMNQPVVIDACTCYPPSEAACCGVWYMTYGENTNV